MTTTPDAVEALECAILEATDGYTKGVAKAVANFLELEGFTISRAETSLSPEQMKALENAEVPKEHDHLNAELGPEMTDAELLLNCQSLAMEFADDNMRKECELAAFELVKKYRGGV